ncbi:MAG: hypothetical protein NDF58_02850 [archaeon YNP-LCB-024-027]|nr:hypothetical protein [Candidatus Culexarchaeum yellowstonense]
MGDRGFSRIIEVLLAMLIISYSSITIPIITNYNYPMDYSHLQSIAFNVLYTLDSSGDLSVIVYYGGWNLLVSYIKLFIPQGLNFNLLVYDENHNLIFSYISNSKTFNSMVSTPFILKFRGVTRIIVLQVWM